MPRYRQIMKEDGTSELVEISSGRPSNHSAAVQAFEPFVSPVDGRVIADRSQLAEHNKRNNVVQQQEFGEEHFKRRAKEREKVLSGSYTREEKWERKAQINEIINHLERANQ